MKMAFFEHQSLQKKFVIITFTVVIVFMIIMGIMITKREHNLMHLNIERQGKILAETLAIPVMNDLIYEKLGLVEEGGLIDNYVREIYEKKDIDLLYLAVLDVDGRVISHNDFNEYGEVYNDPLTVRALSSDITVVQTFYDINRGHDALDFTTPLSIGKKRWGTLKFAISLEGLDNQIQVVVINVIVITFVLMVISFGMIMLLNRRFIRPITDLAKTMEAARGDMLDVKVNTIGGDEIALLGQSYNRMMERIRESNSKINRTHEELLLFVRNIEDTSVDKLDEKVNIDGCDEITLLCESFNEMIDRIRESNIELKKTHEKLLQSQKLASIGILSSGIAHEINNPLGGMFNCIQMLEHDSNSDEERERYINLLNDGLSRIENTVGKLLWMARKEDKTPQLVEVRSILKSVNEFVEYQMKQNNIILKEDIQNGISVYIDPHDLHQVLMNLIINAIHSMKNGGTLSTNAYKDGEEIILEIADTGKGINKDDIQSIFDPFFTTKMPGEGTGLGLWLTYEIVTSYDGEISVESENGRGSSFTIKFKRAVA